jgi:hypothetical protein
MWAWKASTLLLAADALHGRPKRGEGKYRIARYGTLLAPAMMLYGMSLECLIKALAVKGGHLFVRQEEEEETQSLAFRPLFKKTWKNHDLIKLKNHAAVELTLTEDEESVCRRLRHYIVWVGRYPTGTDWRTGLRPTKGGEFDQEELVWDFEKDYRTIHDLAERIFAELGVTLGEDGLVELPNA